MSDSNKSDTHISESNVKPMLRPGSPTKGAVKERLGRVGKIVQTAVQTATTQAMTELKDEFKESVAEVRDRVTESDRYTRAKQGLNRVAGWYKSATATAEAQGMDLLQAKQADWEQQVGQMGGTVAQKEQQVRQRLRSWLQSIAAKR